MQSEAFVTCATKCKNGYRAISAYCFFVKSRNHNILILPEYLIEGDKIYICHTYDL